MVKKRHHIIFQHGWGLTPDLWSTWDINIPETFLKSYLSRGYFGAPLKDAANDSCLETIFVCHSLGLHIAPLKLLEKADTLVICGGFISFHDETGFKSKLSKKVIDVMLKELDIKPEYVVNNFYSQCGIDKMPPFDNMNKELLIKDLEFLDQSHFDLGILTSIPNILIFHGMQDQVVPVERAYELHDNLQNSKLIVYHDAGHGLPFTHAPTCVDEIFKKLNDR